MYLSNSIIDGLKILGFDKETIKKVSREKSLEEIFLSTLFLNYLIVLIVFVIGNIIGNVQIGNRDLNMPVFFGLLMVYPFVYNVVIYIIYGLFGVVAELLSKNSKVKPLISVGFHTAIVYTIVFYVIGLLSTFDPVYGLFLFGLFFLYFLLTMFLALSTIYNFSVPQTLIVLFVPIMILFSILLVVLFYVDLKTILSFFFS